MNDKLIPSDPKDLLSAAESARQFLANCQDRSVYSNAVHHYTQLSATGQHRPDINLDPAKANLARIIDLNAISRVLLVDWHESVLPRFLAEQGIQVVVYPADEEIGDLVETHCQGLATAEVMDCANAAKTAFNMDGLGVFDLIYTRWDATSVS
ncbi:MAG: hypothetical protein QF866_02630, partial [Arenicellales bacterium]|nr:hypothetical protein [Arenicellales bacterium]